MMKDAVDLVVVGAGLSGGYAALLASERWADRRIVVIDSGARLTSTATADGNSSARGLPECTATSCPAVWEHWPSPRPRPIGGRSWCWHGVIVKPRRGEFAGSPRGQSWFEGLCGKFDGVDWFESVAADLTRWEFMEPVPEKRDNRFSARVLRESFGRARHARSRGRDSLSTAFLPIALLYRRAKLAHVLIHPSCRAIGLESSGPLGTTIHTMRDGVPGTLSAKHVMLAAGSVENARLLNGLTLRDGRVVFSGRRIWDHLVAGASVKLPENRIGPVNEIVWRAIKKGIPCNMFATVLSAFGSECVLDIWLMAGQDMNGGSIIQSFEPRVITPNMTKKDLAAIQYMVQASVRTIKNVLADRYSLSDVRVSPVTMSTGAVANAEFWRDKEEFDIFSYVSPLGTADHEGANIGSAQVLNEIGWLKAEARIAVLGPSAFPCIMASNPTFTSLAAVRRLISYL